MSKQLIREKKEMRVKSKENSEHYIWGNVCEGWHLVKTPGLSVVHELVPPGCSEVLHFHRMSEQFFFVVKGTAEIEIGGNKYIVKENCGIHIPAGVVHKLNNKTWVDVEFMVISAPPSHGDKIVVEE